MKKPTTAPHNKLAKIYLALGKAMTEWQMTEMALTQLFSILVSAEGGVASAVFNSVNSLHSKLNMVEAAAAVRLKDTPELLDECIELCGSVRKQSTKRNHLAHYMLYQDPYLPYQGQPLPSAEEIHKRIDWYLSPTSFDGAILWKHSGKVPKLRAIDIDNRAAAFRQISSEVWRFADQVRAKLKPAPIVP